MSSKQATMPKRPPLLSVPHKCGSCEFFTSYHEEFRGNCQEVFGTTRGRRACEVFTLAIDPRRYRKDMDIASYVQQAARWAHLPSMVDEAQSLARDGVFAALRKRKRRDILVTDAADLLDKLGGDSSEDNLVPLFERVQRLRDRAVMLRAQAQEHKSDIDVLWQRAESTLLRKYREVRTLKPSDVRQHICNEILSEIDVRQVQADTVLEVTETVIRNCQSAHSALIEIQAAYRANPAPFKRTSDGENGKGGKSYIDRRPKRRSR